MSRDGKTRIPASTGAGAAVVAVSESGGSGGSLLGVGMCLLAAVSYAIAVVGQKPALRHASALQVTTFGCFAGTVATLPFAAQLVSQTATAPVSATLMLVYLGVEHILVMERLPGRHMLPEESVHHRNGVKDNNRPENL